MNFWRYLVSSLVTLLSLATSATALDWKSTTQSVATAPFQTTQDAVFAFHNKSSKPVTIRDVQTSCDCLEATSDRKLYQPGESGEIRARFTVGDRIGLYERVVTVVTDEPGDPVRLLLQIEVPEVATLAPRSVAWKKDEPAAEKTVELTAAPGLEIVFADAQATNDAFTVRLETVEAGRHYRLHLKARDTKQPISAAIRVFGKEKSGHNVVVSAYTNVE
jgi:hypothetical protein